MVDDVKDLKGKKIEEGATIAQNGHFHVQNKPQNDSQDICTVMSNRKRETKFV